MDRFILLSVGSLVGALITYIVLTHKPSAELKPNSKPELSQIAQRISTPEKLTVSNFAPESIASTSSVLEPDRLAVTRNVLDSAALESEISENLDVHPRVVDLMQGWQQKERIGYWTYLSDSYGLPRQGYNRDVLSTLIMSMSEQMFEKFAMEVSRDENMLSDYRLNSERLKSLSNQKQAQLHFIQLKEGVTQRLITQLETTQIIQLTEQG